MQNANFKIEDWLKSAAVKLNATFKGRLLFIGLQGSYARNEATKESDIDLVVILDELKFDDLKIYRSIIMNMENSCLACGFISGKDELQKWSKQDLFQFFYDTKPIQGKLEDIIEPPKKEDIKRAAKTGAENLYHMAVHSFVHSNNYTEDLKHLYKNTFFILQTKYFIETEKYIPTKKELLEVLLGDDKEILDICINKDKISNTTLIELETLYAKLIQWSRENITVQV